MTTRTTTTRRTTIGDLEISLTQSEKAVIAHAINRDPAGHIYADADRLDGFVVEYALRQLDVYRNNYELTENDIATIAAEKIRAAIAKTETDARNVAVNIENLAREVDATMSLVCEIQDGGLGVSTALIFAKAPGDVLSRAVVSAGADPDSTEPRWLLYVWPSRKAYDEMLRADPATVTPREVVTLTDVTARQVTNVAHALLYKEDVR